MAKDEFEQVHDAAQAYVAAYTEQKDYTGDKPRRGHRVNVALDDLAAAVDGAMTKREEEPADEEEAPEEGDVGTPTEGEGGTAAEPAPPA